MLQAAYSPLYGLHHHSGTHTLACKAASEGFWTACLCDFASVEKFLHFRNRGCKAFVVLHRVCGNTVFFGEFLLRFQSRIIRF